MREDNGIIEIEAKRINTKTKFKVKMNFREQSTNYPAITSDISKLMTHMKER